MTNSFFSNIIIKIMRLILSELGSARQKLEGVFYEKLKNISKAFYILWFGTAAYGRNDCTDHYFRQPYQRRR